MYRKSELLNRWFVILSLLLAIKSGAVKAQTQYQIPKHEVNLNLANTLIIASVEVGYKYFIDYDQSLGVRLLINERRNFRHKKSEDKYNTQAVRLDYSYYFGRDNPGSGFYIQPMIKYRFGDFKETKTLDWGQKVKRKTDMNSFIAAIGVGYEWNISNSFVFGPFVNIGRNFSKEVKNRFSMFEFNAGFDIGYRF
ncbi:MAG TPA: autotransporter domain-containing protein [Flavobacteriaceae bacterium]|nr:autotransporter domain-containing protein [Flavobacteriaceae bacterium]